MSLAARSTRRSRPVNPRRWPRKRKRASRLACLAVAADDVRVTLGTTVASGVWKAPSQDGQVLLWPDPQTLLRQTSANTQLLSRGTGVAIQNVPLPELRSRQRQWI